MDFYVYYYIFHITWHSGHSQYIYRLQSKRVGVYTQDRQADYNETPIPPMARYGEINREEAEKRLYWFREPKCDLRGHKATYAKKRDRDVAASGLLLRTTPLHKL